MNKEGYIKIMKAIGNLIFVIMTEAGKAPVASARKLVAAFLQASTGKSQDQV